MILNFPIKKIFPLIHYKSRVNRLPFVYNRLNETILTFLSVIEMFEEAYQRKPGELSIADLPAVLKLKKELCEAQVWVLGVVIVCVLCIFLCLLS